MSGVRQAEPPKDRRARNNTWPTASDLADKALAYRGEWFAVGIPDHISSASVHAHIRNAILKRMDFEVAVSEGVAHLRIGDAV